MKRRVLNASPFQFLRSVKCFITSRYDCLLSVYSFIGIIFVKENNQLMLYPRYFLKEIHCLTLHRCYFFTVTLRQPMLSRNCRTSLSLDRSDMIG
jgi:hypothetical protein